MELMKSPKSGSGFNLKEIQNTIKTRNDAIKNDIKTLESLKTFFTATGTIIINKELELAITKQINEISIRNSPMILNQQDVPILINNSKSPTTPTK
jgi:hypothetical protein